MRSNHFILMIVFLCASGYLNAQNYKEDIKKALAVYSLGKSFSCSLVISVYQGTEQRQPVKTIYARQKKQGENFYYELDNVDFLMNKDLAITVNKIEKKIFVDKRKKEEAPKYDYFKSFDPIMDSVLNSKSAKVTLVSDDNGILHYVIKGCSPLITQTDVFISKSTGFFTKLEYRYSKDYFGETQRVVIKYNDVNTAPVFEKGAFSETQFVFKKQDKYTASDKFIGYKVIQSN